MLQGRWQTKLLKMRTQSAAESQPAKKNSLREIKKPLGPGQGPDRCPEKGLFMLAVLLTAIAQRRTGTSPKNTQTFIGILVNSHVFTEIHKLHSNSQSFMEIHRNSQIFM